MDTQALLRLIAGLITENERLTKELESKTEESDTFFQMYQDAITQTEGIPEEAPTTGRMSA